MSDTLLDPLPSTAPNLTQWMAVQRQLKQLCINLGASIVSTDPLLTDIKSGDTEGTKWAKLQRWMTLAANNASGGGGGGGWPPPSNKFQSGIIPILNGQQGYAVAFSPAITAEPTFLSATVQIADSNSPGYEAWIDRTTISASGFTIYLSSMPAADGGVISWGAGV